MKLDKDTIKKLRGLIVFTILCYVGLQHMNVVISCIGIVLKLISPFLLGACMAFILNVPMRFLEDKLLGKLENGKRKISMGRLKRPLSLVLTILFVLGIIFLVFFVVVPELGNTFVTLKDSIPQFLIQIQHWAEDMFKQNPKIVEEIVAIEFDWEKLGTTLFAFLKTGAGSFVNSTVSAAVSIASALANFFIGFVFSCYILLQKEKLGVQVKKLLFAYLPEKRVNSFVEICELSNKIFSNFLTGQCLEAVILGIMFFASMTILQFPYALLVGVLISFTALIPIFGAFIGCIVGAFLILMVSPIQALGFLVLFIALQQIEGNLIYPHVVGNSVGLPSIWVLVAVTLGGSTMGILGMLVFIPIASVLYALVRKDALKRLREKKLKIE